METARVAIPVLVVAKKVVLEDADMIVAPVVLEDAEKDVADIVRTPVSELPQDSPPINLNHLLVVVEVVAVIAREGAKIVVVRVAERHVQIIVHQLVRADVVRLAKMVAKLHVMLSVGIVHGKIWKRGYANLKEWIEDIEKVHSSDE